MNQTTRRWRTIGITVFSFLAVAIGVTASRAEVNPTIQLTNSANNWTVQTGTQVTLNTFVNPYSYRTLSKMEIRQGNMVMATCANQNSCYYTVLSVPSGVTNFQALGYDVDGRVFYSSVMSLTGQSAQHDNIPPEVSIYANYYEVDAVANSGLYIEARSMKAAGIRDLRIYRTDNWSLQSVSNCNNTPYDCTTRFYPVFSSADAGKTYTFQAQATDAQGRLGQSNIITIRVRAQGQSGNQLPGVYLDKNTIPEQVDPNSRVNIRAEAWDHEGLNRLSIYVTRQNSYGYGYGFNDSYEFPFVRHCNTLAHNVTCNLEINSFWGYEGRTFDVWAETIDAAGQRVVSNIYTIRVTGTSNNNNNQKPGIYLDSNTIPSEVTVGSHLTIRAEAWDKEQLSKLTIYLKGVENQHFSPAFKQDCTTSLNNLTCVLNLTLDSQTIQGYAGNTFAVWAVATDAAGQYTISQEYLIKVRETDTNQKPGISINVPSEIKSSEKLTIKANAWDQEGLSKITLNFDAYPYEASNNASHGFFSRTCTVSGHNASCTLEVNDLQRYQGRTVMVSAFVVDAAGNRVQAPTKNVKILAPTKVAPTVDVTLSNNSGHLQEDQTLKVSGKAHSNTGVWGVEVRVQPSWTNKPITRRCIMNNKNVTTGTCDLTVGPFRERSNGGTVKVWVIAWDTKTGMGGSSEVKTLKITSMPKPNVAPSISLTPSKRSLSSNEQVTLRANASDDNGIQKIDLYVNARVVKTCTNVNTCEFTGGPYSDYAGTSISYAAKVWDKTGKETWTGYKFIPVRSR